MRPGAILLSNDHVPHAQKAQRARSTGPRALVKPKLAGAQPLNPRGAHIAQGSQCVSSKALTNTQLPGNRWRSSIGQYVRVQQKVLAGTKAAHSACLIHLHQ